MKSLPLTILLAALVGCGGTIETGAGGHGGASSTSSKSSGGGAGTTSAQGTTSTSVTTSVTGSGCACGPGFTCCNGACVNTGNDINNCGACNVVCPDAHPYCGQGKCGALPCVGGGPICDPPGFCCGMMCCNETDLCCDVPGPGPTMGPKCTPPQNGTCPPGCPACQ